MADTTTFAARLLGNQYAQEKLNDAAQGAHAAYKRATKRRTDALRDTKLRKQVREAAASLTEATRALEQDRHGPERSRGKRVLVVVVLGAAAAGTALAASEELRNSVFGNGSAQAGDGEQGSKAQTPGTPAAGVA